jgi:hypothetical protein
MEVHSHTHTPRKKWTHYFWEFFMLFLAVTLGFFVENQREHIVEHHREKQYIQSLVNDIKVDTSRMNSIISYRILREKKLDSLTAMLNRPDRDKFTNAIYFHAVSVSRNNMVRFIMSDGTMQQLKNSGAFRLIRNRIVADSIAKYDVTARSLLTHAELEENLIEDYREAASRIFNSLIYEKMLDTDNNVTRIDLGNPPLLNFSASDLDVWNYRLFSVKALNKAIRRDMRLYFKQAENLLEILKKEYHTK